MKNFIKSIYYRGIVRLFHNKKGQGLTEYALILAVIAIVAVVAMQLTGDRIKNAFQTIADILPKS